MTTFKYNESPYAKIPEELVNDFTMNQRIPIFDWFLDGRKINGVKWDDDLINEHIKNFTPNNIKKNTEGISPYGNEVCINLLKSFEDFNINNKNVAVVGSESPWIEAILINLNNKVTTIEYNVPESSFKNLECKDYFNFFEKNSNTFDAIVTFSSIEHSGLGRYGDPLDPNGDFKTMDNIYNNLVNNGILIWGAPVGKDALTWNAHRVYGPIRLPLLFTKFNELKWYGFSKSALFSQRLVNNSYQPVVVLKKN